MRVSISRVKEVDARVEAVGGDGQGVEGTGQAGAEAAGGDAAGGCPSLVWSVDCLAFANLLYNLRRVQVAIRTMMMTMVVVTALGRWMFMKDQLLSTEVVFLISSATSVVGGGGGETALHILAVQWSGCQ